MKTPMQQLFEEMKEKGFFIAEYIKRPALEMEKEYAMNNYWAGYKEGQYSGDKTAEEYYNEQGKKEGNREEDELEQAELRVQANSPYNDGWTKEFYEKELKRYNAGAREWPAGNERFGRPGELANEDPILDETTEEKKEDPEFMYNWIREKSGKK